MLRKVATKHINIQPFSNTQKKLNSFSFLIEILIFLLNIHVLFLKNYLYPLDRFMYYRNNLHNIKLYIIYIHLLHLIDFWFSHLQQVYTQFFDLKCCDKCL